MKLIVEAGATKTHWGIIDKNSYNVFDAEGYNPNISDESRLGEIISNSFPANFNHSLIDTLHYYGAGCSTIKNQDKVSNQLKIHFPQALIISVKSDLEAAANALFQNKPGIVAIMGTGANSGYYNGEIIAEPGNSLGYLLGDEGSGAYLGSQLLRRYLRNELFPQIQHKLSAIVSMPNPELIRHIYSQPNISRYFAGFVPFIKENMGDESVHRIVDEAFDLYIQYHLKELIIKYPHIEIGISGGVAFAFKTLITEKIIIHTNQNVQIIEQPFDQLIRQFLTR